MTAPPTISRQTNSEKLDWAPVSRSEPFVPMVLAALAGFIVLLVVVPRLFTTDPSVHSVASVRGYSTNAAFGVAAVWSLAVVVVCAVWLRRRGWGDRGAAANAMAPTPAPDDAERRRDFKVVLPVVLLATLLAYWPTIIGSHGPYVEDGIFLNAMHRMYGGMQPYRDFEFLYGPLMIAPPAALAKWLGYDATIYYAYLAAFECIVVAVVTWWSFRTAQGRAARFLALAVLLMLLMNPLMGLNYNGVRRLLPAAAVAFLSLGRTRTSARIAAAALTGVTLAYAHEMGTAALAGCGAIFAIELLFGDMRARIRTIVDGITHLVVALVVWIALVAASLGVGGVSSYLHEVSSLVPRFAAGEAGFPLTWSLNSIAAFALLAIALVIVAGGLARRNPRTLKGGDRLLIGALGVALLALKSGLTRADMFHLDTGFVALAALFLAPFDAAVFVRPARLQRFGALSSFVLGATYAFGNLPTVSQLAQGWVAGAGDIVARRRPAPIAGFSPVAPSLLTTSVTRPDGAVDLAACLASPPLRGRPVLFYGRLWALGPTLGIYKRDFLNDVFIYADERGLREREFLQTHADAVVLMDTPAYERIFALRPEDAFEDRENGHRASLLKRVAAYVSSAHFDALPLETRLHDERWRRLVGNYVRQEFHSAARFGRIVLLVRQQSSGSEPLCALQP